MSRAPDVAVVGGGIVGCALAAFLAEAGARVVLYEREAIAAGASGRNSGVLQHPLDHALTGLYEESLEHYRTLGHGFELPAEPSGLLIVGGDAESLGPPPTEFPELAPVLLEGAALVAAEPALTPGLAAYRLETGRPVPPAAAANAFAMRARAAGAEFVIGAAAYAACDDARTAGGDDDARGRGDARDAGGDDARVRGNALRRGDDARGDEGARRVTGVIVDGVHHPAGGVAIAAGPWTPEAVPGAWAPIAPLWGVVAEVALAAPPRHVIEEAGIDALTSETGAPASLFSIVTARGVSAVGSTFLPGRPEAAELAPLLIERGARFVPALRDARIRGVRACARPASADGRPLLGTLPGLEGLAVASGHGAWGVTLGPASARIVADLLLGRPARIAPDLAAGRFGSAG